MAPVTFKAKRAITLEEHQQIIAAEVKPRTEGALPAPLPPWWQSWQRHKPANGAGCQFFARTGNRPRNFHARVFTTFFRYLWKSRQ